MEPQNKPAVKAARLDPVPTVFADGLFGASLVSGTVRLDLFMEQLAPDAGGMQPTIVGRLVMPADKLEGFVRGLTELVQQIQNQKKPKPATSDIKLPSGTA